MEKFSHLGKKNAKKSCLCRKGLKLKEVVKIHTSFNHRETGFRYHPSNSLMPARYPELEWLIASPGEDFNWWVKEVSDPIHWDFDGLGIIDPRQWNYIMDHMDPLREFSLDTELIERAFIGFSIEKNLGENRIRMTRSSDLILDNETALFVLPDVVNEENGPYAEFLDHITTLRIEQLNDLIEFEQSLTRPDLEEVLRDEMINLDYEGKGLHHFTEITFILEYVPAGYDREEDPEEEGEPSDEGEIARDIPDPTEGEEAIPEDETMRWDEEQEGEEEV